MGLEKGYAFNIKEKKYIIISVVNYNGTDYGFLNEVADGEPEAEKYHIIFIQNGILKFVDDMQLSKELIPLFQEEIKKDLKNNNLI